MRPIEEIQADADGFSRSTFSTKPGRDYGYGPTRSIVATIDRDDIEHPIAEDLDDGVAEPLARLLNDVNPLVAEVIRMRAEPSDEEVTRRLAEAADHWDRLAASAGNVCAYCRAPFPVEEMREHAKTCEESPIARELRSLRALLGSCHHWLEALAESGEVDDEDDVAALSDLRREVLAARGEP